MPKEGVGLAAAVAAGISEDLEVAVWDQLQNITNQVHYLGGGQTTLLKILFAVEKNRISGIILKIKMLVELEVDLARIKS